MAEARVVRFICGHCVCCIACTDLLLERHAKCPVCTMQIMVIERGTQLLNADTFVEPQTLNLDPDNAPTLTLEPWHRCCVRRPTLQTSSAEEPKSALSLR